MRTRLRAPRGDDGASATVVAITISLLMIVAAFAVDIGYAYAVRRQLQTAADAAALAGCRELIAGGSGARVLAVASEYTQRNALPPADGLTMLTTPPSTQVGADFVQVTVAKNSPAFFSRVMGRENLPVTAVARAKVAYLTGMRGVVPWAAPVIRASRVTARVAGGPEIALSNLGGGVWRGSVPVRTGLSASEYSVDIVAYNSQTAYPDGTSEYPNGVPESLPNAASVLVLSAGSAVRDVRLSRYVATSGDGSATILVRTSGAGNQYRPTVRFDGKKYSAVPDGTDPTLWRASVPVPTTKVTCETFPVNVNVDETSITNAAVLIVRRPTYPIADVALDQYVNPGGAVSVTVRLHDYQYGVQYPLKLVNGAEVGNFCALDLATIKHPPYWRNPQHPSEYAVSGSYYDYLEQPFPFVIHIGDTIWTETGNLSGPQTERALDARFAGDTLTFAQWEALGRPPTKRVIFVPVMEKMQTVTGQTPLRVVSFAAFFVEPGSDLKGDDIVGRFIEYASPSDTISDTPPSGLYIKTVRLVTPE